MVQLLQQEKEYLCCGGVGVGGGVIEREKGMDEL